MNTEHRSRRYDAFVAVAVLLPLIAAACTGGSVALGSGPEETQFSFDDADVFFTLRTANEGGGFAFIGVGGGD